MLTIYYKFMWKEFPEEHLGLHVDVQVCILSLSHTPQPDSKLVCYNPAQTLICHFT